MADTQAYERYMKLLVDRVRDDPYPSGAHMDMVEAMLPRELLGPYVELLLEKVERERYPSIDMLRRIERLVAQSG